MKRTLGLLCLVAAVTVPIACGEDDDGPDAADDTATQRHDSGAPTVVDIVSASAVDGDVSATATVIRNDQELARYVRQFHSEPFVADLTDVIEAHELADDRVLGLAVIEISCDEPPSATVTQESSRFYVTPAKVVDPLPECFAPVTSVAVLDLPA